MTRRFLSDASTLIALAAGGRLDILRAATPRVHATQTVLDEALLDKPGAAAIRKALDGGWLVPIKGAGTIPGLGPGEASIILAASKDDVLILDDRAARLDAKARGLRVTGLLGLLVNAARLKRITRQDALATLEALARGRFRMSTELYVWARKQMDAGPA